MNPFPVQRLIDWLTWLLRALLFVLLLGLAPKNSDPVVLRYYFGLEWQAPMALVLFVFFVAGTLLGLFAMLGPWARLRGELKRRLSSGEAAHAPVDHA